ncbi:MAG TPA: FGGY-family carbohydrate kinase [Trebonia sp.]|jgi:sugar (pentulose or hexulose) kinase|nr:FGGY-family carbohydrate kinase [Trebonia sp.]
MDEGRPLEESVCAVDVGSSAIRAAVINAYGRIVRMRRRGRDSDAASTAFDVDELWAEIAATLRELFTDRDTAGLRGMAVTAHVGSVIVDRDGRAVWAGFGWADGHGTDLLTRAWSSLPEPLGVVGRPIVTGGGLPVLSWLQDQHPDSFRRARWLLSPKDLVVNRLTDAIATDVTSAAYTLALDVRTRRWSKPLCAAAAIEPSLLPPIRHAVHIVGRVSPASARHTGLPAGLPVVAGGPDGTVSTAALADPSVPVIIDIAGSTDVVTRITSGPPHEPPPGALINPYLNDDLYSCGGPTGMTGGAVAFLSDLLGLGSAAAAMDGLGRQIEAIPPGSDGLRVMPAITGSRFPHWQPAERGAVIGLAAEHTTAHLLRAAHEGAAYVARECADLLSGPGQQNGEAPAIVLAGGTARSPWLTQLRADVMGRTVLACAEPEIGLLGAAMLAAVGCGLYPSISAARARMSPPLRKVLPNPQASRCFSQLYAAWAAERQTVVSQQFMAGRT